MQDGGIRGWKEEQIADGNSFNGTEEPYWSLLLSPGSQVKFAFIFPS